MLASPSCQSGFSLCLLGSSPFCLLLALLLCPLLSLLSDGPGGRDGAGNLVDGDWGNLMPVSICDSEELSTEEGGWGARDEGKGVTWEAVYGAGQRGEGGMLSMSFKKMANSKGERGHPCLTQKDGCTEAALSPSSNVYSSAWYRSFKMDRIWSGIRGLRKWPQNLCLGIQS